MNVYLAGPIAGQTAESAIRWRTTISNMLSEFSIISYSPLRMEKYIANDDGLLTAEAVSYAGVPITTRGFVARDKHDIQVCDAIVVNFNQCANKVSIGSCFEIAWAHWLRKIVVVIMDADNVHQHPFVTECTDFIVPDERSAAEILNAVLNP